MVLRQVITNRFASPFASRASPAPSVFLHFIVYIEIRNPQGNIWIMLVDLLFDNILAQTLVFFSFFAFERCLEYCVFHFIVYMKIRIPQSASIACSFAADALELPHATQLVLVRWV